MRAGALAAFIQQSPRQQEAVHTRMLVRSNHLNKLLAAQGLAKWLVRGRGGGKSERQGAKRAFKSCWKLT